MQPEGGDHYRKRKSTDVEEITYASIVGIRDILLSVKVHVRKLTGRTKLKHRLMQAWRDRERHEEIGKGGYALSSVLRTLFIQVLKEDRQKNIVSTNPLTH
jgi:hypothetical protein